MKYGVECVGIIVHNALYGEETWNVRGTQKRRLNGVEMVYLRSTCGVNWMDSVRNEEIKRKGVMRELASREEQCVL